ncbi:MAG: HAD family phosphatase [Thermodesulfobacteriota bacterium]|nr:HAD family phosphatase [Thermodesulfobacteriota bacterium]
MNQMKIIIFDFDGVILDSENSHFIAFNEGLKNLNINISEDEYYSKYISLDDRGVITNVVNDKNISVTNEEIDMIIKNKNDYFESRLIDNSKLFPGVEELIIQLSKNFVLSIGSGANRSEIIKTLKNNNIYDYFEIIVSADEVNNPKPNPETYNRVLDNINTDFNINEIIVIEDSPGGIEAAKSAGLKCIAITNTFDNKELGKADIIVSNYEDILKYLTS